MHWAVLREWAFIFILNTQEQTVMGGCLCKGVLDWTPAIQNEEEDGGQCQNMKA